MDGRTEVESVASVAVESSCVAVTVPVADEIPAESRGYGGGEVEGVEESCDGGNKEEIMVGIVGSDVFVDVVSGNHDGSRDGLEENSEVFVHVVSGNHGTCNDGLGGNELGVDTVFVGSDAAVEENIGFKNAGDQVFHGGDEILDEERNQIVSEERKGEVAGEVESAPEANGDTSIVVMTTEVELREEIEDGGVVDAVRDEVRTESLMIDDKEVLTELETAKEEISCVGRSSHGGVLEEEAWNPGIVSASASCSVMLETNAMQHEIIREDSVAMLQVNSSSLDDKIMIAHEVIETAEVSVRDNADEASTYPLMIETDGVKQQEVAAVPQESTSSFKDEIPSAHEVSVLDNENHTSTACPMMLETDGVQQEEVASTVEEINSASKDDIPVAHETATDHTSALYTPTVEADGMQPEQGAAVAEEINLSSKDEIPVDHEIAETGTELSVSANADHTSASCSLTFETDGMQQEEGAVMVEESTLSSKDELQVSHEEEVAAMVDESNLSSKDEFPVAHETTESATEPFFSANADHTSASYPLTFQTDGLQQEKGSAMVEESKLSSKDEIPVAHEMTKTATELSVPDNTDHTSASCSLMLESDGVHQEDGAAMDEEINLSSKDAIPVAHETETATEHSVTDNTDHASASCSLMLESDGEHHEIITEEDVVALEVNKSTCKDETVVVDFASEPSVPDDANQTPASCPASLETDGVQNEVVKEESVPMLQENDSSFKDNIPGVHETNETAFKVANNSQVIDANGTHDITNRDSVSSFHHDASDCKVKAVHCTISPSDDKKDVNFGILCSVEDSMEVNALVNPAFFCQYIGSDIGVGTSLAIADEPQQVIEKEVVQESPVEFDSKPGNDNHRICSAENDLSMTQRVSCGNVGGEDVSPELAYEHLSDVDIVIDFDDVVDVKDEATDLDAPMEEICCTGNTDDICAVPMTGDEELAQSDLSMLEVHAQVYTGNTEALASKEDDVRELPDGNKFQQEIEKLDALDGGWSEKEGAISENTVVASDGQVIDTAACLVKSHETVIKGGDSFPVTNPQFPVEMPDTSGTDLAIEGSVSSKTEKEDELVQANQINAHECQGDDKIFAEETIGSPMSLVQSKKEDEIHQANHIIGHELHGNEEVCAEGASGLPTYHVGFIDEGNNDNVFQDGKENMETSGEVQEYDETMKASICEVASSSSDISNPIRSHKLHGDDKISAEGDFGLPTSHVLTSGGCSVVLVTESNNDSVFLDENQKMNVSADIHKNETMETSIYEVASSAGGISQAIEREDADHKIMDIEEDASEMGKSEILESSSQPSSVIDEQTLGAEKYTSKSDRAKVLKERKIKPSSLLSVHQSGYFGPSETDDEFAVSDLVWGKVRSHPWWPGQIFDPSDASDRAVRYIKKDAYLVAYFGDRTFAWNDASVLKPFRPHFSQIVKQRNSEVMQIAIDSALEEVSRRVKLGLSCSCTPKDVYQNIECQIVGNAGIREESSHRYGVDETSRAALFEPDKLVEHIRVLAQSPLNLCDRFELAIAEAQLSSFCHFKRYRPLPLFESHETSFEDVPGTSIDGSDCEIVDVKLVSSGTSTSHRRKEILSDSLQPEKERSLSELMIHTEFSPDDDDGMDDEVLSKSMGASFGKKRKAMDSVGDNSDKRVSIYAAKLSTTSSSPKTPSFKVGDCIRRVATQLTGASSSLKASNGQSVGDVFLQPCSSSPRENVMFSPESSSTSGDMLSQLQLFAQDPKKRCGLLKNIIVFLSDFRNSVVSKHAVSGSGGKRKRKTSHPVGNSTEEFEFDDVNDSYWKDKAIENCHDEQLLQDGDKGDDVYQQEVVSPPAKVHKPTRRPYTRKKHSTENYEPLADEPVEEDQSMKRGTSPAELIMNFVKGSRIPSQISLNNMFRRFGSLKEYETEVDHDSCRARVIFKKGVDAEVAYSSAGTFNIFGSMQVTYQLSYSPTSTRSELPLLISQGQEVGT